MSEVDKQIGEIMCVMSYWKELSSQISEEYAFNNRYLAANLPPVATQL